MLKASLAFVLLTTPAYASSAKYCQAWARGAITMEVGHLNAEQRANLTLPAMIDVLARFMLRCGNLEQDYDTPELTFLKELYDDLKAGPVVNPPVKPPIAKPPEVVASDPPAKPPVATRSSRPPPIAPAASKSPAQVCGAVHMKVAWSGKSWHCRK